jgi:predicted transcriptional regulator
MEIFRVIERIKILHNLIQTETTGTPSELANRLGISRSSLYNMIDELKSYNAPIKYSRAKETFLYTHAFSLNIYYSFKIIENEDELKKIVGGLYLIPSVYFFRQKDNIFV